MNKKSKLFKPEDFTNVEECLIAINSLEQQLALLERTPIGVNWALLEYWKGRADQAEAKLTELEQQLERERKERIDQIGKTIRATNRALKAEAKLQERNGD